eukprot:scaffold31455_cov60-Phaeocystis_antarctica.AAC.2
MLQRAPDRHTEHHPSPVPTLHKVCVLGAARGGNETACAAWGDTCFAPQLLLDPCPDHSASRLVGSLISPCSLPPLST